MTDEEIAEQCLIRVCASVGTLPNARARGYIIAAIREAVAMDRERRQAPRVECLGCEGTGRTWTMDKDGTDGYYGGPQCRQCNGEGMVYR